MELALEISSSNQVKPQVELVSVASPLPETREHMFEKVVTPSDVGKLNRLVIPKHHAEKHFPLDAAANGKGVLLSFEDSAGKPWRFRYSYWGSSQSYVITKGWSRFVKDKGLGAGDTITFSRGAGDGCRHRLYIDWKHRSATHDPPHTFLPAPWGGSGSGSGQLWWYRVPAAIAPEVGMRQMEGGSRLIPRVLNSMPLVHGQAAVKRVRLFGVNLDCPESGSVPSSSTLMCKEKKSSPVDLYL